MKNENDHATIKDDRISLMFQLFGDTPKSRILDFLMANKGDPFQKRKSRSAQTYSKPRFSNKNQSKHYYDYFGDLVRLGVVKALDNCGRYQKYAIGYLINIQPQ